ncbi:MAG: AMP-binding protein, partial [bacterium]|nr:AMP-binding protein [bacterium]
GTGKTTTMAKMAANYVLENGTSNIILATLDSYRVGGREQLNSYANHIAGLIENQWPRNSNDETAALLFDHGADMIAAILGALKSGKAYVPLSPDYPDNRLSYILKDSQSSLILTNSQYAQRAFKVSAGINIDPLDITTRGKRISEVNQPRRAEPAKNAYIMYTSGSTGHPKGVIQNHGNVLYYTRNWVRFFSITGSDRMSLFSSFCHDGSVQDMFAGLLSGATLCPYYMRNRGNITGSDLSEFMRKQGVTVWHSVPSLFSYFTGTLAETETFPQIRLILLGGEPMRKHEPDMCSKHFPNAR